MPVSLHTGTGLITPHGADTRASLAAIWEGRPLAPGPDRSDIPLAASAVDDALADQLVDLPNARPSSWRGTGTGIRAGLLAAVEAVRSAGLLHHADRFEMALVVAGHNLTATHAEAVGATFALSPAYVPPSAAVRLWDTDSIGLISQLLDLRGEAALIGGASASGLVAVNHAHRLVSSGVTPACLVVAPAFELTEWQRQALTTAGAMRPLERRADDPGRPFDATRDGFVASQLAAAVVLEHPDHARRRGAVPLAEQHGAATRLAATSGPEPDQEAERDVILAALADAKATPADVDYVNAHGTGSPLGDVCELAALADVFGPGAGPRVGSTKALLGHGLTSAGLVEYVVTAHQLHLGRLHPMPRLAAPLPHPGIRLSRVEETVEMGCAVTTSYGFGGLHAAAVLTTTSFGGDR